MKCLHLVTGMGKSLHPQNRASPGARLALDTGSHTFRSKLWMRRVSAAPTPYPLTPQLLVSVLLKTFHGQARLGKAEPSKVKLICNSREECYAISPLQPRPPKKFIFYCGLFYFCKVSHGTCFMKHTWGKCHPVSRWHGTQEAPGQEGTDRRLERGSRAKTKGMVAAQFGGVYGRL